jgi:tRNA(Arg) A34 adenosine deaminase TadA
LEKEIPVGCVLVRNGVIISVGRNQTNLTKNATRHAELVALEQVLLGFGSNSRGYNNLKVSKEVTEFFMECVLYVTIEPCIMCTAALRYLGVQLIYYCAKNERFGGCGSVLKLHLHPLYAFTRVGYSDYSEYDNDNNNDIRKAEGDGSDISNHPKGNSISRFFSGRDLAKCRVPLPPLVCKLLPNYKELAVSLLQQFYTFENPSAPIPRVKKAKL